jgi:4-amino-4-deoxy-L-arabinose transferase-like glycosyltransferase
MNDRERRRLGLRVATVLVALVGLACLEHTRRTLSGTFDESNHLAAGLEWWQFGTYTLWTENPPLARIAVAAVPYLHGTRLPPMPAWDPRTHDWDRSWEIGNELLYAGDGFEANLGRARLGTLPFFVLTLAAAFALANGRRRPVAGLIAVALTATLPALIAHGALATTDVAFTGTFLLALVALARWLDHPTPRRAALLGASFALALLTKLSTLVFFPAALLAFVAARVIAGRRDPPSTAPWRVLAVHAALALGVAFFVTWAGYRFSIGRIEDLPHEVKGWLTLVPPAAARGRLSGFLLHARLPMPELWHGLRFLAAHDAAGHDAYLLGRNAARGFLSFYPIALAVKTPLPLIALLLLALPRLVRDRRRVDLVPARAMALAALAILLVSLRSQVNIGIRHVFVMLPLVAVAVAIAFDTALADAARVGTPPRRWALIAAAATALVCAQAGIAIAARDASLGYFNLLAGRDPATVLLDSDLDWGQDLFALRREARARGIDSLAIAYFGMLRPCQHDLPPLTALSPGKPVTGWIAISENYYRDRSFFRLHRDPCDPTSLYKEGEVTAGAYGWLRAHQPVTIAGSSIRLYHLP